MTEGSDITISDMNKLFQGDEIQIPELLPLLDLENAVLFPLMVVPQTISREAIIRMISDTVSGNRLIGLFTRIPEKIEKQTLEMPTVQLGPHKIARLGCVCVILRMLKIPDGAIRVLLHGLRRISIEEITQEEPYPKAKIKIIEEVTPSNIQVDALIKQTQNLVQKATQISNLSEDLYVAALNINDPGKLADIISTNLNLKIEEQLSIINTINTQERLEKVLTYLEREVEVLELGNRIRSKVKSEVEKNQREFYLREQLKAIHKELGEEGEGREDIKELRERLEKKALPKETKKVADKELKRMEKIPSTSPEYAIIRTYIDWILDLPWKESTKDNLDIQKAEKILNEDHYDLNKIKNRILEYLSVVKLRKSIKGPILCFVGPPGVGKTSLGKSIARALGRKFQHFSLGGMRDEAEIRGHRRTYIGALPGRIISGLKNCGTNNPVMMLDEVDKIGADFRGDPASALLEVLDPEQNNNFRDHYLDLPFDLSKVMFITTANVLHTIPPALQDRMEILRLPGYTLQEKTKIARRYLIPKEYEANGVSARNLVFTKKAIETIIEKYTQEAGLRNLQREIGNICRKIARQVAQGNEKKVRLTGSNVSKYLGPPRFKPETAERSPEPGVAIGLAWTQTGGQILFVEASATPGKGKLLLTGQLGEVMKESAQAAMTYLHSQAKHLKIEEKNFSKYDVHLHVPAGAIPKDGPSAGITMCTSLASLFMKKNVSNELAMTGEITLKGNVLPVGGIKEKVLAAHRAGIKDLILPQDNEKDLVEIPSEIKREIKFHFAQKMDEVLKKAFHS